ncbi:MAG: hypothetical protein JKX85_14630 [Phycisphaeraceae bacterium]|nr:hypothetical protein [Phycisphaeraceae bacterium]
MLILLLTFACSVHTNASPAKPFPVRALHLALRPHIISMAQYRQKIDQAVAQDYNMLILHAGGVHASAYQVSEPGKIEFNQTTSEQVTQLLDYARKAGLEPVFEIKVIGKQASIISKSLLNQHPSLLVKKAFHGGALNLAYRFPDGRDAYDVITLPMLDNFIALYGKTRPRYLLLGTDEVPVDALESSAKALGTTTPKLFASLINRCVDHLLAQGITPIMWGDMFLSGKLNKPGHGIKGFTADPRILDGNASYLNNSDQAPSTLLAMNHLKNRDKIIISDWHYGTGTHGEYPSVDYFQTMGFKDVWGTTWYDDDGIRLFSRYASKRGCGGMIATAWHMTFTPSVIHHFPAILNNASVYFRNPTYEPVEEPIVSFRLADSDKSPFPATEISGGVFPKETRQLFYEATLAPELLPQNAVLMIRDEQNKTLSAWETFPLRFDAQNHRLTGRMTLPSKLGKLPHAYSMMLRFLERDSGYMVQRFDGQYFQIMAHQPSVAGKAMPDAFLAADFSQFTQSDFKAKVFYATGQFPTLMQVIRARHKNVAPAYAPVDGVLNCQYEASWANVPGLWKQIVSKGMRLTLTFKMISEMPAGKKDYAALLSMGAFNQGMRLLINRDRTLLLQFAEQDSDNRPIWITSPVKVKLNQWQTVQVTLTPLTPGKKRQATLQLNEDKTQVAQLPNPISPYNGDAPLGLGVEFKRFSNNSKRTWPLLSGQISSVQIKPY